MLDYERVADEAAGFIRQQVNAAGASGVAIGLSGGICSSVVMHLSVRGVGAGKCLALTMPNGASALSPESDDGRAIARLLGVEHRAVPIGGIAAAAASAAADGDGKSGFAGGAEERMQAAESLGACMRAAILRYEARKRNLLVAGTDDRTKCLIGCLAGHGGGTSDMLPIADLYRTQVRLLGQHLGVPRRILEKPPSPHLWKGQDAPAEPGTSYAVIDEILAALTGEIGASSLPPEATPDMIKKVGVLHRFGEHKRRLPPIPMLRAAGRPGVEGGADPAPPSNRPPVPCGARRRPTEGGADPAPPSNPACRTVERRPWGMFERFTLNQATTVKIIRVDPASALSLQLHSLRSEYWFLLDGEATAVLGGEEIAMRPGDDCFIPAGMVHRLAAGEAGARLLEIAFGDVSEDDIVRLSDSWGRA